MSAIKTYLNIVSGCNEHRFSLTSKYERYELTYDQGSITKNSCFFLPRCGNVANMLQIHYSNYFTKTKAFTQIEI